ncbi:MAG: leucyl/phenylalanyl-tRNA--protein transferase [Defluviitaleaceae bacterium]|nr:leucyl/phenylalanyl-tRNA--protein transferase [Defluviitaleaceae bacterium]
MAVFKLTKCSYVFPPTALADSDGLLAYGGDLSMPRLLSAYQNGIFPWFNPGEEILWWSPHERFVIFPKEIHVSRSMKKAIPKSGLYTRINFDFAGVVKGCRARREGGTWLSDDMEEAYNALFENGYAMSVGVYKEDKLVGGLYGVLLGRCFFGESMFSDADNASKLALIDLCKNDFVFVDCQFHTPHLEKMGGRYIKWGEYRRLLREGVGDEWKKEL